MHGTGTTLTAASIFTADESSTPWRWNPQVPPKHPSGPWYSGSSPMVKVISWTPTGYSVDEDIHRLSIIRRCKRRPIYFSLIHDLLLSHSSNSEISLKPTSVSCKRLVQHVCQYYYYCFVLLHFFWRTHYPITVLHTFCIFLIIAVFIIFYLYIPPACNG
jgi:hypothetical protein